MSSPGCDLYFTFRKIFGGGTGAASRGESCSMSCVLNPRRACGKVIPAFAFAFDFGLRVAWACEVLS